MTTLAPMGSPHPAHPGLPPPPAYALPPAPATATIPEPSSPLLPPAETPAHPWAGMPSGMSAEEEAADPHLAEAMRQSLWLQRQAPANDAAGEAGSASGLQEEAAPRPPPKDEPRPFTAPVPDASAVPTPLATATAAAPLVESPVAGPSATQPTHIRPRAVTKHHETVEGKDSIDRTIYIDPCLRNNLFTVPAAIRTTTDSALTAASAYGDGSFNWTTGAPIGGMAALAKSYILPPDVRVEAENGGVTLRVGVVDEGPTEPTPHPIGEKGGGKRARSMDGKKTQGRTKARVEVVTNRGGVEFDLVELAPNRQIDISIETGKGDVLLLLPPTFHGPVHLTCDEPALRPLLAAQAAELVNPYESVWTTHITPLGVAPRRKKRGGIKHGLMRAIANYVPEDFREESEYNDMAVEGFAGLQKGTHSRIVVKTRRGKVVLGYRGGADERGVRDELRVGAGSRQKHWWTL